MNNRLARMVAAGCGFSAILLGAFGAHALHDRLTSLGTSAFWQTAVLYHLVHSAVLLLFSGWPRLPRLAFLLIFWGIVVFSGSLYLLALTNVRWLGAITPLGGFAMLAGWLVVAIRKDGEKNSDSAHYP